MARPRNVNKTVDLHILLPEEIKGRLDLLLHSEIEQRIPVGAYQRFISARIQEFFSWRRLNLDMYGFPEGYFVAGPRAMIDKLEYVLKGDNNGSVT